MDYIAELGELNDLNRNVFELNEDKTITYLYVSKNKKKEVKENYQLDTLEGNPMDSHDDNQNKNTDAVVNEQEKSFQKFEKTVD